MKRYKHNLSHYKLLSMDQGKLVPIGLTEVLPGDTFQHSTSALIRVSPLVSPVMHPVEARIHHFFVPHRLVWDDWENFITGGPDGLNASVFPTITFPNGGPEIGTLADYLGVPTDIVNASGTPVSALPFRAYALIFNEFYRDQDLVTPLTIDRTDGADTTTNTTLQSVAWEKDRFTMARDEPQKGPAVTMPLGTTAPVTGIGKVNQNYDTGPDNVYETDGSGTTAYAKSIGVSDAGANQAFRVEEDPNNLGFPNIRADLSEATAATISELRTAFALQRYAEVRSLYGSRYTEYLRYLGIRSSDARLQRPEYLGGGKQTIQFSEVVSTAPGTFDSTEYPTGTLAGHGIGAMRSNRYRRFFEEHGYVISLLSVKPRTMYAQGLAPTWNRRTKEDFFQKELQFVGQQEIKNKEVYASAAQPDGTFGYIDRYDEYRRSESSIAGEFRSNLDSWHMARIFGSEPALNATFVTANPTDRIYASSTTNELYVMANHKLIARRMVAKNGVPHSF